MNEKLKLLLAQLSSVIFGKGYPRRPEEALDSILPACPGTIS